MQRPPHESHEPAPLTGLMRSTGGTKCACLRRARVAPLVLQAPGRVQRAGLRRPGIVGPRPCSQTWSGRGQRAVRECRPRFPCKAIFANNVPTGDGRQLAELHMRHLWLPLRHAADTIDRPVEGPGMSPTPVASARRRGRPPRSRGAPPRRPRARESRYSPLPAPACHIPARRLVTRLEATRGDL